MLQVWLQRWDDIKKILYISYWLLSTVSVSFNKLQLVSGHFTKDCFSAPGLQYALLPEEDDEVPQQQTSTVKPQQDSDKKKKKKVTCDCWCQAGFSSTSLFFVVISFWWVTFSLQPVCLLLLDIICSVTWGHWDCWQHYYHDASTFIWWVSSITCLILQEKKKKRKRERKDSESDSSSSECQSKRRHRDHSADRQDKKKKKHKKHKSHKHSWGSWHACSTAAVRQRGCGGQQTVSSGI